MVDYNTIYKTDKELVTTECALFVRLDKSETWYNYLCIYATSYQEEPEYNIGAVYVMEDYHIEECDPENAGYYNNVHDIKREFGFLVYDYFMAKKKAEIVESIESYKATDYHLMDKEDVLHGKVKFLEKTLFSLLETL